ncbi:DUF4132 domain-containing protein [Methanobrevibacter filiformis]|uniref:DUF4132 domain-containing protein n=1 Tax=Methanobrevibacter filiformis TaxID=55758 RepID=A0A162FB17_9EURY|nr:DUF4132 domain-containing protein [Methanobrevibacter filiformis]KZX10455.1 hypothetical protein MBFIL_17540 [Methanobrevibacter filiformis]
MDINKFLNEYKYKVTAYDKKKELEEKYTDKRKFLIQMFDYSFDTDKFIENWGIDFEWEEKSFKILEKLFGNYAELVRKGWNLKQDYIYQDGYLRRSFRAPGNREITLKSKASWIKDVFYCLNYDLNIEEYAKYAYGMGYYTRSLSFLFAADINNGNEELYKLIIDIINGRSNEGKIDSSLIKTLLLIDRVESRETIANLLLAAQRQEGLRQSILETLDEAHPNNLKYIIEIILKNDLIRFSSVVRAFGVWTGLGWEEPRKNTIKRGFELGIKYLNDEDILNGTDETIEKIADLKDVYEIYMALWACGVYDIENTFKILDKLLKNDNDNLKMIAIYFISQTQLNFNDKILDNLNSDNLSLNYLTLDSLKIPYANYNYNSNSEPKISEKEVANLKNPIIKLFERTNKKSKFNKVLFDWFNIKIDRDIAMNTLIRLSDIHGDYEDLLEFYSEMNANQRSNFSSSYLNESLWSYNNQKKKEKKPLNDNQRVFAIKTLSDRSNRVQTIGMKAIKRVGTLKEEDILNIESLLKRKSATLRKGCLEILRTQPDEEFLNSAKRLIAKSTAEERKAGLDILISLKSKEKYELEISNILKELKQSKKITITEKNLLKTLESETEEYSFENGFGLYDPGNLTPTTPPKLQEPYWKSNKVNDDKNSKVNDKNSKISLKSKILSKIRKNKENEDKARNKKTRNSNIHSKLVKDNDINKDNESKWFSYSISYPEIIWKLKVLDNLINDNKDAEYEIEGYYGNTSTQILGNYLRLPKMQYNNDKDKYKNLILHETWMNWFEKSGLTSYDIELLTCTFNDYIGIENTDWVKKIGKDHIPYIFNSNFLSENFKYPQQMGFLINMFNELYPYEDRVELCLTSYENMVAAIPEDKYNEPIKRDYGDDIHWQDLTIFNIWTNKLTYKDQLTPEQAKRLWNIKKWSYDNSKSKKSNYLPRILTYAMAYEKKVIKKEDIYFQFFATGRLKEINSKPQPNGFNIIKEYPFLKELAIPVIDRVLEIELKRGDNPTNVSNLIPNISKIEGIDRFFKALQGMDKETFVRSSYGYYYNSNITKKSNFSAILKALHPQEQENSKKELDKKEFKKQFEESGISEERLVEVGMYSPQWLEYVDNTLNWKGFLSGAWWLYAHANDYLDERKISEVGKYTNIEIDEFKVGAVDVDWFKDAYNDLGEEHWNSLYNGAKYISSSAGHRRAQIFADTIAGKLTEKEIIEKIENKRNQDYVRAFGLLKIPNRKDHKEKAILRRYKLIQKFLLESKQFGAQRQESEKLASEIAIDNLARTSGFTNTLSFKWIMEGKVSKDIIKRAKPLNFDKTEISLNISSDGKIGIKTIKNGKLLKNIPVKLRKDPKVIELKDLAKELTNQNKRTKENLEETMINANIFKISEIHELLKHPVVGQLVKRLVLKIENKDSNNKDNNKYNNKYNNKDNNKDNNTHDTNYDNVEFAIYKEDKFIDINGNEIDLIDEKTEISIAHTLDLYKAGVLSDYQRYAFENKLVQPFKQIFREIYLLTPDEEKEKSISRRYSGNQVQPKVTASLLKSRGWNIDYEEGLKKLFRKQKYMAKIYALADWFTPSDVESPTIETVEFIDTKTYKNVDFDKVKPIDFSEVMRDVDLIVSVAHAGEVDPEASHSTIEMRLALIKETVRLLDLKNIQYKKNHVMIDGKLSSYSVHLGSGVVHKQPGGYISILPVHSQHRGRIFLPFADNDPKSAEIISKILLLSEDDKIEDPTILKQITTQ